MTRAALGRLRSSYSTWPAEFMQSSVERGRYRGMLVDQAGQWWQCGHRHQTRDQATVCARARNAQLKPSP